MHPDSIRLVGIASTQVLMVRNWQHLRWEPETLEVGMQTPRYKTQTKTERASWFEGNQ